MGGWSEIGPEVIWAAVGILLILMEFAVPGLIVIFFGIGALAVGLLIWVGMPTDYGLPFIMFSVISVGALLLLRKRFKLMFVGNTITGGTGSEDDDFLGRQAEVESGFDGNKLDKGRVFFRGTQWQARAKGVGGFAKGDQVRIVDRDGSELIVEKD